MYSTLYIIYSTYSIIYLCNILETFNFIIVVIYVNPRYLIYQNNIYIILIWKITKNL